MISEKEIAIEEHLKEVTPKVPRNKESYKRKPSSLRDSFARGFVSIVARSFDIIFKHRYGHRAVVLETIAAVPGMVGATFQHLKSLRYIRDDRGWIQTLLDEAENERVHLIVYSGIAMPTAFERFLIIVAQCVFFVFYSLLYILTPKTAHRMVGFLEEEAIHSYETYLSLVESGEHENVKASALAKYYWDLDDNAMLTDVIKATIKDEMIHRDVNHRFADDGVGASHF